MFCKFKHNCIIILIFSLSLFGCASSEVSQDVESNIDLGVTNAQHLMASATGDSIADTYQNSNQTAKGLILGGVTGALVGSTYSSMLGFVPGTAIGAILGASYGNYLDSHMTLHDRLENRGVNVAVLGDQILITVPSARVFYPYSSAIKPQAYSTLNLIALYISGYVKMLVNVSAYTNNNRPFDINLALSKQQAQTVAKFLLAAGVNARVLYADGYGSTNLVVPSNGWDNDNYRIEINLEKLYV